MSDDGSVVVGQADLVAVVLQPASGTYGDGNDALALGVEAQGERRHQACPC